MRDSHPLSFVFIFTMFNPFGYHTLANVMGTSHPVNNVTTDLLNGEVVVEHTTGIVTVHDHVSRLAILNLLYGPSISIDLWVEHNLSPDINAYVDNKLAITSDFI
jgi:hypothetical protein